MPRRKKACRTTSRGTPERILALDTSSVCVGFAVFDGEELKRYGRFLQKGVDHGERLHQFRLWLLATLKELQPDQLIFEAPFAGRRRYAFGVLMMYVAVVLMSHVQWADAEIPSENRVPAAQVKRILKAERGATHETRKRLMVLAMNKAYGLSLKFKSNDKAKRVSEDDVADAIALGRAWLIRYRGAQG